MKGLASILVNKVADLVNLDMLTLAYHRIGVLNYRNVSESGERFLVYEWLPHFLVRAGVTAPILLDIGANGGMYTSLLKDAIPTATIYSLEPNPATFRQLREISTAFDNVHPFNVGLADVTGEVDLYVRASNRSSVHATLYRNVAEKQHGYDDIETVRVRVETLDDFCKMKALEDIHFVKIDTEGHELKILQGAQRLIEGGRLWCIQFEFNEMNLHSNVFLADFFDLLAGYRLFRLLPNGLLPVSYSSKLEIFQYQNFLGVRRELTEEAIPNGDN